MNYRNYMKITLVVLVLCLMSVGSYAHAVMKVVGANSYGPIPEPILTPSIICTGATCPAFMHPELINSNGWIGGTSATCKYSSDDAVTWAACASLPAGFGGGNIYGWATTSTGAWLGVASIGENCNVARSTDRGVNWTIVYNAAPTCSMHTTNTGSNIRCVSSGSCILARDNGSQLNLFRSTDDGLTWGTLYTDATQIGIITGLQFDGTNGFDIGIGGGGGRVKNFTYTITGESGWVAPIAGFTWTDGNMCAKGINHSVLGPAVYCGLLSPKRFVNAATGAVTNITLSNGVLTSKETAFSLGTGIYIVGTSTSVMGACSGGGNKTSVWVSMDNAVTFYETACFSGIFAPGDVYTRNGKVYVGGAMSGPAILKFQ